MKKQDIYKEIINYVENNPGFIKYNNIHIEELKDNYCKCYVDLDENSMNPSGFAHGGLLFGLADSAMGMAARTNGKNIVTLNTNIDYLKPGKGKRITCIAEAIKVGKTTAVYRTNLYIGEDKLIATCTGTFFFLDEDR